MDFDYRKNFFSFYMVIVKEYKKFASSAFKDYNLTPAEVDVLTFLINNAPEFNTSSEISFYTGISKGLVSRSVHALQEKGIISMEVNPEDKRSSLLIFREEALPLVKKVKKDNTFFKNMLMEDIAQEDLDIFFDVNQKLVSNLAEFKKSLRG